MRSARYGLIHPYSALTSPSPSHIHTHFIHLSALLNHIESLACSLLFYCPPLSFSSAACIVTPPYILLETLSPLVSNFTLLSVADGYFLSTWCGCALT